MREIGAAPPRAGRPHIFPRKYSIVLTRPSASGTRGAVIERAGHGCQIFAIGLCESFSSSYISSQYSDLIVFALLIAVMLVRPQGVFGQPPLQKV